MEEKKLVPKLRFPGFTEPWEQRKLGDVIASLYNGQTPSRFDKANWEGDIPWLTSGELNRGVVNHSIEKITPQGRDDANLKIVPKGTVVIAITGLEAAGTRGNCAKLGFDTTLNQSCMAIYPKSEFLDPDFLFQWYIVVGEEYGIKYTQGTKQQSYNAELIKILPISVPRVTEQRKITRILDSFDDIITLHQRKLEHLKLKKKSLLQKLFPKEGEVYPEFRFPGFTDPWEQRKLGEISEISTGFPFDSQEFNDEGEYLVITNSNIQDDSLVVLNNIGNRINIDSGREKYILDKDDLLITMDGTVGRIAKVINDRLVLAQRVCRMKSGEPSFLYQLLSGTNFIQTMNKISHGGAIKHISLSEIAEYQCHYPQNKRERDYIGIVLGDIDNLITLHQRKLEHLQLLKKALLQQLFV